MSVRVFIVDDHYLVIEGIRSMLRNEPGIEWVGHAMNAESCLAFLKQNVPEVILMDINLPGMNGMDLCRQVKETYPSVFILGLSTFNQQAFIQKMMDNGASGYLLKNASREELIEGISAVIKGKTWLSAEAAKSLRVPEIPDSPVLTRREKEVLGLIGEGLTNNEIAERLFISINTVETHRKNLLQKFKARNIASLIKTAVHMKFL